MDSHLLIKFFITMLAIMNPIGGVAIFLSLTSDYSEAQKRREALKAALSVFLILLIVTWLGMLILELFGINVSSFRIAGGIIILLMGLHMLQSKPSPIQHTTEEHALAKERDSIAVIPMALPLIAGPGAISTIVIYGHDFSGWGGYLQMSVVDAVLAAIVAVLLFFSGFVGRVLGDSGTKIVTRIMGLILAAMAVDMITAGLSTTFPGLAA
ncbi:MarC family protein [Legionella nagasakiensis]|uniref:MarC family protein n=1 Tax=Legionella nagasakiensis TaxID=535290 RepID=UPI001055F566|nr:MarC family protein [Legionella nagasakiensis]